MSPEVPPAARLRGQILNLVEEYHAAAFLPAAFTPDRSPVPVSGKVFDSAELRALVDASLDFWLTSGRYTEAFERELSRRTGIRAAMLVNSGSSANLVALSALTSPALGERRLRPGDEIITVAAGFPTTVNPIVQNGLIPVFVDITLPTYNIDVDALDAALSPRTRGIMVSHTLGNPFAADRVRAFADAHDLWLIEDCCDALGARVAGRPVGTFGEFATLSFYPAHHITTGEGGAVLTNSPALRKLAESFRDWGRDCWCAPGKDNTCGKRFDWHLGDLPCGFDHKYTYAHIGYNLKATDMQAAVGLAQLDKLPDFIAARRANFDYMIANLGDLGDELLLPEATPGSEPSWFGLPLAVRAGTGFARAQIVAELERRGVATRLLFGGNLTKQPAYREVAYRAIGALPNTDFTMDAVFWIGLYPGLSRQMLDHTLDVLHTAIARQRQGCP